jgi:hypothetical protein
MRHLLLLICVGLLSSCALRSTVVYPLPGNGLCGVHHNPLERRIVQVSYGYPAYDEAYVAAMGRDFPHAEAVVNGGCDPSPGPRKAPVLVCAECKRAQQRWARRHPSNWQAKLVLNER